jgi:hypothetical protein
MRYIKTSILFVAVTLLLISVDLSCKKDNTGHIATNAIIINSGPVAADGCGWLVKINGTNEEYSPINLSATYQTDSLKVSITYHVLTTKLSCGSFSGGITQIQLNAIKT